MKLTRTIHWPQFRHHFAVLGLALACVGSFSCAASAAETARYQVTFDAAWSPETHPINFPPSPHFSPLIGGLHNADAELWRPGEIASAGIEAVAELGSTALIRQEVEAMIAAGTANAVLQGPSISPSPNSRSFEFEASADYPLLSLVTMLAPSPDWFVGTHGLSLRADDEWLPQIVFPLAAYDSGSDSGPDYTSANADTNPKEPIRRLTDGSFNEAADLGTFTLLRLLDGDLTQDGLRTAADIDALSLAIRNGETAAKFDLDMNGAVDQDDRRFWVEQLERSYFGDANLDGQFDSTDFVATFQAGEYEDLVASNSTWSEGDWDGDGDFLSSDFVLALADGNYEGGPRAAAAVVPEPSAGGLFALGVTLGWLRRRQRAR